MRWWNYYLIPLRPYHMNNPLALQLSSASGSRIPNFDFSVIPNPLHGLLLNRSIYIRFNQLTVHPWQLMRLRYPQHEKGSYLPGWRLHLPSLQWYRLWWGSPLASLPKLCFALFHMKEAFATLCDLLENWDSPTIVVKAMLCSTHEVVT